MYLQCRDCLDYFYKYPGVLNMKDDFQKNIKSQVEVQKKGMYVGLIPIS